MGFHNEELCAVIHKGSKPAPQEQGAQLKRLNFKGGYPPPLFCIAHTIIFGIGNHLVLLLFADVKSIVDQSWIF